MKYWNLKAIILSMVPLKLCFALNRIKRVVRMYKIYHFNDLFGIKNIFYFIYVDYSRLYL